MLDFRLKGPFKLEKDFTTAFLREVKNNGGWAFKISDLGMSMKPFDTFFMNSEGVFFCEIKIIDGDIFDIKKLRVNQFTSLERISNIVDRYFFKNVHTIIIVYSLLHNDYIVIPFDIIINAEMTKNFKIKLDF